MRCRLAILLLAIVVIVGGLALAYQPLLTATARWLIVQDPLDRADIIIMLSGGRGDERVRQAADLYHQGYAPAILLSGGEIFMGISVPELLKRQAQAHGIPVSAMLFEGNSTSTYEQAVFLRPMLEQRSIHRAIVVTSTYHTRRARYIFHKVFAGSPIDIRVYPVQDDRFNPVRWWTREQDTETVVLEYIKLGVALLR
jgi:uncharacterized SAM-binding protein YcdF (DUF218 family)